MTKLVYVLVVGLVLVLGGIGGYLLGTKKTSAPEPTLAPKNIKNYPLATTSNETAGWRTFSNNRYGFQLMYPSNLILTEDVLGLPLLQTPGSQGAFMRADILDNVNPQGVKLDSKWFQSFTITIFGSSSKPVVGENVEEITIDSTSGIKVTQPFNDHTDVIFYLPWKTSVLNLTFKITPNLSIGLPDQILSTFKFLPLSTASAGVVDETAGWKTYTNSRLGFSFKYPNTWDPTIEESFSSGMTEIALSPYLNISVNFVGGWMGKNVKEETVNIDGVRGVVSLWLNCSSNDAKEWEACNSQLSLSKYDTAVLRAQFNKGQDKWLVTSRLWKKGEKNENVEFDSFKQILSTFKFL